MCASVCVCDTYYPQTQSLFPFQLSFRVRMEIGTGYEARWYRLFCSTTYIIGIGMKLVNHACMRAYVSLTIPREH